MKVATAASLKTQLSRWENGRVTPDYYQQLLCDFYQLAPDDFRTSTPQEPAGAAGSAGPSHLITGAEWLQTLGQLDQEAGWQPGTARQQVTRLAAQLNPADLHDRASGRQHLSQRRIAGTLGSYYLGPEDGSSSGHGRYGARIDGGSPVMTSVLTRPDWLDLRCPLGMDCDQLTLRHPAPQNDVPLSAEVSRAACNRLAEAMAAGGTIVDRPLYRLLDTSIQPGQIAGSVAILPFIRYALTMDLLEGELLDALATATPVRPGTLPLRDRYLPDLLSVLDLGSRICAGGALALCAIARPASRGPADYALVVQQRSGQVLNAARRLAVIPKGFHQPMTDYQADAPIGTTLLRELEEELFGRQDTDTTTATGQQAADPLHPGRLSAPMRWLASEPGRLRMECTGFGLNLVSGNFEFASLIVIQAEEFWSRYGADVVANWESSSLRLCSTRDMDSVLELAGDPSWSGEGLFAFLQGLRRLRQLGADRVNLPAISWEIG